MRIAAAAVVALVVVPSAAAASFSLTITTPGPVTASGITLSGDDQSTTFAVVTQVAYTGANNTKGWSIDAKQTQPKTGTKTLPFFTVTNGTFACVSSCTTDPASNITFPITLATTAREIYNAAVGTGQGTYAITSTYEIDYPANAFPGTYSSTLTLTGSTGP